MEWYTPVAAVATGFLSGLFVWLTQRSKGQVDESVAVRQQWEKLTSGLSARLAAVEKEFADYRTKMAEEIEGIRKAHADEVAEMRREHSAQMKALTELNEGLQRQIIQNSRSTAQALGEAAKGRRRRRQEGEDQ